MVDSSGKFNRKKLERRFAPDTFNGSEYISLPPYL
jgi:hypothetical protein